MSLSDVLGRMIGYINPRGDETTEEQTRTREEPGDMQEREGAEETGSERGSEPPEHNARLFHRDKQIFSEDKTSLDLMIAVEQTILAKRMSDESIVELRGRLRDSREQVEIANRDLERTRAVLAEKEQQIEDLKEKLAEKNMQIDHAQEQYRGIESEMAETVDELKNRIDVEQRKYEKLQRHSRREDERHRKIIEERDQTLHELEGENANLRQQLDQVKQQNSYLMNVVRDFTDQVSESFVPGAEGLEAEAEEETSADGNDQS